MDLPLDQENIINILGIESLPDERKVEIVEKTTDLVQKRLILRLLGILSEEDRGEMSRLLDANDEPGLQKFLQEKVPQLPDLVVEEVGQIKKELAELSASIP